MCVCVSAELEASKSRLLDSEREKSKLASLAQQRLKEMEHLKRWACVWVGVTPQNESTTAA